MQGCRPHVHARKKGGLLLLAHSARPDPISHPQRNMQLPFGNVQAAPFSHGAASLQPPASQDGAARSAPAHSALPSSHPGTYVHQDRAHFRYWL